MAPVTMALCISAIILPIVQSLPVPTNESSQAQESSGVGSEGYIIVVGGFNGKQVASCFAYDINAGKWLTLPDLPTRKAGAALVSHENNVYSISGITNYGYNNVGLREVLGLFTKQNVWKEGPPLGTIANEGVNAVPLNGSLYVLGGYTNHMEKYDACRSGTYVWEQAASTLEPHQYSGAAELNGYIYVCGTTWYHPSTFCERYDPVFDAWSQITPMNEARDAFSMVSLNGYLYVIGGADANNERYDPVSGEWSYFSRVPAQSHLQAAATDGKKIYVVGGNSDDAWTTYINEMNVYVPEFDIWQMQTPYEIEINEAAAVFVKTLP